MARKDTGADIIERGDIHFLYRPDVRPEGATDTGAHGMKDVERLYMIMKPEGTKRFRMMVVGRLRGAAAFFRPGSGSGTPFLLASSGHFPGSPKPRGPI